MRVLWFSADSALYQYASNKHGGWISALQREILKVEDIELGVAFPWRDDFRGSEDKCIYYGIKAIKYPLLNFSRKQSRQLSRIKEIVDDFQPDVIHVFGTENGLGLVCQCTSIPVVVHIQGILGAYFETFVPYNMSWKDYVFRNPKAYLAYDAWKKFIPREREIFRNSRFFMGRTEWDKSITRMLSPHSQYFHCEEMLRPEIRNAEPWQYKEREPFVISSVFGSPIYKGGDVILRTAALLKAETSLNFIWNVYGINDMRFAEQLTGIMGANVGVVPRGRVDVVSLISHLQNSSIFIHPSYIENSSNAICEAQYLGLPIIATHAGGTTSLVKHEENGLIVPVNDIYMMASQIMRVAEDYIFAMELGRQARREAQKRHDPKLIVRQLMYVYDEMLK